MDCMDIIYERLATLNLAANKTDYSKRWLGMEDSYYRNKTSKQRPASARVYGQLACKLMEEASTLRLSGDNQSARDMSEIASTCLAEIIATSRDSISQRESRYHAH